MLAREGTLQASGAWRATSEAVASSVKPTSKIRPPATAEQANHARAVQGAGRTPRTARLRPPPRIMILTSSLGSGHVVAAQAIEQALRACAPDTRVHTVDFWTLMDRQVAQTVRQAYLGILEHEAELYDRVYRLDQRVWRRLFERDQPLPDALATLIARLDHFARTPAERATLAAQFGGEPHLSDRMLFRQLCTSLMNAGPGSRGNHPRIRLLLTRWIWARLAARLEARMLMFEPDAMIATQMGPAALAASIKTRRGLSIPLIGVSTDFGVHDFWAQPGIDAFCVAHDTIAPPCAGVAKSGNVDIQTRVQVRVQVRAQDRVYATGIPLLQSFRRPPSQRSARRTLGLDVERPVVLVQGGGLGLGVSEISQQLLAGLADLQVAAVAAGNDNLYTRLTALGSQYPRRLKVWHWTDQMATLIRAADLVVGKPGGLTVAEVLACGRPLIASRVAGGQEGFNLRFLGDHGVGWLVADRALIPWVRTLLGDATQLTQLQQQAWALGRRDGARRIAGLVLGMTRQRQRKPAFETP